MSTRFKLTLLLLFPLGILLSYLYTLAPNVWENFYSLGINKVMVKVISHISGIIPISLFEWSIYIGILSLLGYTGYTLFKVFTRFNKEGLMIFFNYLLNLGSIAALLFFAFIFLWGLNYKRPHFSERYGIVAAEYSSKDLGDLYAHLVNQAGLIRDQLPEDEKGNAVPLGDYKDIFNRAQLGYNRASLEFDVLSGKYGKPKAVLASPLMNYTGITGIYSPFTGEPNVNVAVPPITIPSTTCHEMAHQRGYGFENECNFIAYIICLSHPDPDFQYSGYLMALAYTSNALSAADRPRLLEINATMSEKVLNDLVAINEFWSGYEGEIRETAEQVNNSYLQSNGVESGTQSYGEMVDLILALYDKYH